MEALTIRHLRALANKRGFTVSLDDALLHIVHKRIEHMQASFDLSDPFRIDPACAQQFTFMCAYYWMRGYDVSYVDNADVLVRRGRSHPTFDQHDQCEQWFSYKGMTLFQHEVAIWRSIIENRPTLVNEHRMTSQ